MGPRRARFPDFPVFSIFRFLDFPAFPVFPRFPFFSSRNPISPRGGPPTPRNHQYSYRNIDGFEAGPAAGPQPPPRSTFQRFSPKSWKFAEIRPKNAEFTKIMISRPIGPRKPLYSLLFINGFARGGRKARKGGNPPQNVIFRDFPNFRCISWNSPKFSGIS